MKRTIENQNLELRKSADGEYWTLIDKLTGKLVYADSANEDLYCSEEDAEAIFELWLNDCESGLCRRIGELRSERIEGAILNYFTALDIAEDDGEIKCNDDKDEIAKKELDPDDELQLYPLVNLIDEYYGRWKESKPNDEAVINECVLEVATALFCDKC